MKPDPREDVTAAMSNPVKLPTKLLEELGQLLGRFLAKEANATPSLPQPRDDSAQSR